MDSANKSSSIPDPVARTLKYDYDDKSPLSSSFRSPYFNSPQKKEGKANINMNLSTDMKTDHLTQENSSVSPKKAKDLLELTPIKPEGQNSFVEDTNLTTRNPIRNFIESPFSMFCKGLDLSPAGKVFRPPEDLLRAQHFSIRSDFKNSIEKAANEGTVVKDSGLVTPSKKRVDRLDSGHKFFSIKSKKGDLSIEVDKYFGSIDEKHELRRFENLNFDMFLQCTEDIHTSPKIQFDNTKKSVYSASSLVPIQRDFSFRLQEGYHEEPLLTEGALVNQVLGFYSFEEDEEKNPYNNYPASFDKFYDEGKATPTLYHEHNKRITLLDSMNSFSGKKTHEEKKKYQNEIIFGTNNNSNASNDSLVQNHFGARLDDHDGKEPSKKVTCNCKKSKCLKLYCECFAAGGVCSKDCNCENCHNNEEHAEERQAVVDSTLERNPDAFKPKVDAVEGSVKIENDGNKNAVRHVKGCNCKKSGCLKKYCECFQAGIKCTELCKCEGCKNIEHCSLIKRAKNMGLLETKERVYSHHEVYGMNDYTTKYRKIRPEMEEMFEEESEEEQDKFAKPRKQVRKVGVFNTYLQSNIMDELMSPEDGTGKIKEKEIQTKIEETNKDQVRRRRVKPDLNVKEEYFPPSQSKTGGGRRRRV